MVIFGTIILFTVDTGWAWLGFGIDLRAVLQYRYCISYIPGTDILDCSVPCPVCHSKNGQKLSTKY